MDGLQLELLSLYRELDRYRVAQINDLQEKNEAWEKVGQALRTKEIVEQSLKERDDGNNISETE